MQTSIFLARLLGPLFIVIALGIFANEKAIRALGKEMLGSYALIFLFGVVDLVAGIAIVLVHNVWIADWRVIITVLGWIMIVRGALRVLAPDVFRKNATKILRNKHLFTVSAVVIVIIGAVLCYYGYRT